MDRLLNSINYEVITYLSLIEELYLKPEIISKLIVYFGFSFGIISIIYLLISFCFNDYD